MHRTTWLATAALGLGLLTATPRADEWEPLFNGKNLVGWSHVGDGRFVVEDGVLKTDGGMGLLWFTQRKIGDSVIRVVYKVANEKDNSGVFIRIPAEPTEPWMPVNKGYEVQITESGDDQHRTGTLYSLTKALAKPGRVGDWNTLEITLKGPTTIVHLNGVKVTEYVEGQPVPPKVASHEPDRGPRPNEGYIGLQNHAPGETVWFREISVKPDCGC